MSTHLIDKLEFIEFKDNAKFNIGDFIEHPQGSKELIVETLPKLSTIKGIKDNNKTKILSTVYYPIKSLVSGPRANFIVNENCLLANFSNFNDEIRGLYRKVSETVLNMDTSAYLRYQSITREKLKEVGL
ncbi:MAG: hypothetical protein ACP5OG_04465 [Candidatus Nanoarchaeia archaeon]